MNLQHKNTQEIQQEIFDAIKNGEDINTLKSELTAAGFKPEGFYFTTEEVRRTEMLRPREPAGRATAGQVIIAIISLIVLLIRIARCTNRMH